LGHEHIIFLNENIKANKSNRPFILVESVPAGIRVYQIGAILSDCGHGLEESLLQRMFSDHETLPARCNFRYDDGGELFYKTVSLKWTRIKIFILRYAE
jgi:hypothetical protein